MTTWGRVAALSTLALSALWCGGGSARAAPDLRAGAPRDGAGSLPLEGEFPFGVWLQGAAGDYKGKTVAQLYKEMGITHWMGLYLWPDESIFYPGYNLHTAAALKAQGFKVFAGDSQAAIDWIRAHPEYADTFVGYLVGDEPDMTKATRPDHHPDVWRRAAKHLREADPGRKIWANFGKGFAKIPWPGYTAHPGPTIQDDHNKFTDFLDLVSVDFYGFTDSYETPHYVGMWTYGKAIENTRHYVDANPANPGLPVWGFVETGNPFPMDKGMYPAIPKELIKPTVWHMIVHGATGIIYFCHQFFPPATGQYPIENPEVGQVLKETNASVRAFGAVLATPTVAGTTVTTDGAVAVVALTKTFRGETFVFAMGDGDTTHQRGQAVHATITLAQGGSGPVQVLDEARTLYMVDGKITDHFDAYQLHVYRIQAQ